MNVVGAAYHPCPYHWTLTWADLKCTYCIRFLNTWAWAIALRSSPARGHGGNMSHAFQGLINQVSRTHEPHPLMPCMWQAKTRRTAGCYAVYRDCSIKHIKTSAQSQGCVRWSYHIVSYRVISPYHFIFFLGPECVGDLRKT